jgi:hypothetical protein
MKTFFTCILILGLFGCGSEEAEQERKDGYTPVLETREDSLFHDVMEGHDEGMAKMGKLMRYQRFTRGAIDSLNRLPNAKADPGLIDRYSEILQQLVLADDAMNRWMGNFKADTLKDNIPARERYLLSEKLKVEQVRDLILEAERVGDSAFSKK